MEPLNFGIFDWVETSASLAPAEVYAHKLDLAAAALGEPLDFYVWLAVFLVIGGVALGTSGSSFRR